MKLFNTKDLVLKEVSNEPFKLERDIQELVEKNIDTIFGYLFISSELTVQKYRLDTLCFDEETNSFVIIEYKRGCSYSVIDQGYTYLQLLLNNKSEFLLTLSQYFNRVLKIEDVDWSQSRVVFISPSFNSYQKDSVNFKNLPFELWEIKRFSNGVVILDQHHSTSKESIESISDPKTQGVMSDVSNELKTVNIDDHFKDSNSDIKELWNEISERLLEFEDTYIESIPRYISLGYNHKKVCFIHVRKTKLIIDLNRGQIHPDGSKFDNFFTIDDPKKISKELTWTFKSGVKGGKYKISVTKGFDIDYLVYLIKQKYLNILNR
jgi:hypothetical protein